jgi:vancomycin resistance protein YoaR
VDEAVARSRAGNILARTARGLTGGKVSARLQPQITYSDAAVVRLLDRVRTALNRPSMNATLKYTLDGPKATPSQVGLALKTTALHDRIRALLRSTAAKRRVSAATARVAPKVTSASLARQASTVLVVNRGAFTLSLYQHFKRTRSYSVAIGAVGLDTPAGLYHIQNKAVNPAWTEPNSSWVAPADRGKVVPGGTPPTR